MEETGNAIVTAITNMATTVAGDAVDTLGAIIPVVAPIAAAVIVATLGFRYVKRFAKG